jgi:hypothetical protein
VTFKCSKLLRAAMNGEVDRKTQEFETPSGFSDEPAKMVRAEKKGATIGPIHGSLEEKNETPAIVSEQ